MGSTIAARQTDQQQPACSGRGPTMRRAFLLASVLALCLGVAGTNAAPYVTYETITVDNTVRSISSAALDPPGYPQQNHCWGRLETAEIRYRFDGGTPTSTSGFLAEPYEFIEAFTHEDAERLRMVRTGSVSAVLKISCWNATK